MTRYRSTLTTIGLALLAALLVNCVIFYEQLTLGNRSSRSVHTYVNPSYPDSSLRQSYEDIEVRAGEALYIAGWFDLERREGVTVFVFDHGYSERNRRPYPATPDTYLDEDSVLEKYCLSRAQLDSLRWHLFFPSTR